MDGQSDLYTKYYKVATEYSKLRSLVPVLKKAVTEEQHKNAELKQQLKEKDQTLRIATAETDSLSFRNQHLMCRLTALMHEVEDLRNPHKKSDHKHAQPNDETFKKTMIEEFNKMVDQNAELISTLSEMKEKHQMETTELMDEIKRLNTELFKLKENFGSQKKLNFDSQSLSDSSEVSKDVEIHFDSSPKIKPKEEKPRHEEPYSDTFESNLKMSEGSHSSREDGESRELKDSVSNAIQKALEEQLIESQLKLQKSKSEYDTLMAGFKSLELQYKELKEKTAQPSDPQPPLLEGEINYIPQEEAIAREKEVKRCYQHKNDLMKSEVLQWKSKSQTFERECQILKLRLDDEISSHNNTKAALKSEREALQKVRDELATTESNYEAQLSAMSDHVANLNDTITKKKDEILELQYHIKTESKKWRK